MTSSSSAAVDLPWFRPIVRYHRSHCSIGASLPFSALFPATHAWIAKRRRCLNSSLAPTTRLQLLMLLGCLGPICDAKQSGIMLRYRPNEALLLRFSGLLWATAAYEHDDGCLQAKPNTHTHYTERMRMLAALRLSPKPAPVCLLSVRLAAHDHRPW